MLAFQGSRNKGNRVDFTRMGWEMAISKSYEGTNLTLVLAR